MRITFVLLFLIQVTSGFSQENKAWQWLEPADTFNNKRFKLLAIGGATAYAATSVGLYSIWYRNYDLGPFHFFNDKFGNNDEWEKVDKAGHVVTAYAESYLAFRGMRWAGVKHKPAVWIGAGVGTILQGTIEVMDGFSAGWGFSKMDILANTIGVATFTAQELLWKEQRMMIKVSNTRPNYPATLIPGNKGGPPLSVRQIAHGLYGDNYLEAFIKDYNGMTVWASINPASFLKLSENSRFPRWLNVAVGFGADGVYGAYGNVYTDANDSYSLTNIQREKEYYLSFDVDLRRIRTRSPLLRTIFQGLSFVKIPGPTLEMSSIGKPKFHFFYW
ncbi:DUF2279 domain-containing protein [Haliscomenobacter hydrossis]|uniref:DUF2279 domain-containing protein n=1 Tax=Haliscomenobacter hydrossis (strain ATCC 27775 / DSM 1100 / LMG 10767 / O) TaxID=760192 RepID=F4KWP2_HALH1|nr:DUF2279 domain-containing protein [Haliscomenobacter hydrossis]AEE52525.1 hypothetical protein Halhy_4690 [Haliscomenobacter hydrossis DSM 1100]